MDVQGLPVTFLDMAGLRATEDKVERIGVEIAHRNARDADLRIHLIEEAGDDPLVEKGVDDLVLLSKDDGGVSGGVSGKTGAGVLDLLGHVATSLERRVASVGAATNQRHKLALDKSAKAFELAAEMLVEHSFLPELVVEEMRQGVLDLEALLGRVDVENVLDEIFSQFCLGK